MAKPGPRVLRSYRAPCYPTRTAVLEAPDLLRQHVPSAWLSQREIAAAAGALLAIENVGCARTPTPSSSTTLSLTTAAVVAPVFQHGNGRVGVGCIAVVPPAMLSEDEALQIIRDELGQAGVRPLERNVVLDHVVVDGRRLESGYEWVLGYTSQGWVPAKMPLEADLMDAQNRVAVEFVSMDDFYAFGGTAKMSGTAGTIDIAATAESLARQVERQGRGVYFGTFYEPAVRRWDCVQPATTSTSRDGSGIVPGRDVRRTSDDWRAAARTQTELLLRQQVKDFVDWLKAQGVI